MATGEHGDADDDVGSGRRGPDSFAAGREVLDALRQRPSPAAEPTPAAAPPPVPPAPPPAPPAPTAASRSAPTPGPSSDVVFAPRVAARRVIGVLTLVGVLATAAAAYLAYDDPRSLSLGVAGTLLVVTLVLYGVRAGSSPARLAIRAGQLEVVRGARREVVDLTSRYARVEVVGTPGRRGWKVLFGRSGRDPFVVDASMVDPEQFTAALRRYRPDN